MKDKKIQKDKQKKTNILLYADFDCATGFGQVAKNLVDNLKEDKNLNILIFATNNFNENEYVYSDNVTVIPAIRYCKNKKDIYCRIELLTLLFESNIDVFFAINNIEVLSPMHEHFVNVLNKKKELSKPLFKSIVYFPIDSSPKQSDLAVLEFFDEVVTCSDYAKFTIHNLMLDNDDLDVKVIPNCVDIDTFFPVNLSNDEKKACLGIDIEVEMPFVFGTVNKNNAIKDLATLIIAFSIIKLQKQENIVLYLHCNPKDPSGIEIENLCNRLGLKFGKDVLVPSYFDENKGYSLDKLNLIYNSFDCFVTTTTAEGWGFTLTEAMAVKKLVVCPNHTVLTEITDNGDNAIFLTFSQPMVFVNDFEKIREVSNPPEVAHVMGIVHNLKNDTEEIQKMAESKIERAYKKVTRYNWSEIANKFKELIYGLKEI